MKAADWGGGLGADGIRRLAVALKARASASDHRLALVLAGSREWTLSAATAALSAPVGEGIIWLTERQVSWPSLPGSQGDRLLGRELDVLVYDAHGGFDPDSFAAALGALRGGGLLLLLTPPPEDWPGYPDPQAPRVARSSFSSHRRPTGRFVRRFAGILARSEGVVVMAESAPVPQPRFPPAAPSAIPPVASRVSDTDCRTPDQARALAAILATAQGRPRRPLVLTSDRGRGKSSALGIAAARLLARGPCHILVTAPRRAALDPVFHQAAHRLPGAQVRADRIAYRDARLEFLPPDALCRSPRSADLLLVDEAAGIPAPLLERLLDRQPRIVFATTVQGYEGTGRGFEVRFRHILDRATSAWRELRLEAPIRWAAGDPLEGLAGRALLLDAAPAPARQMAGAEPRTCRFQRLDCAALADDEATLRPLFGLLTLAHYQTRPTDLRHLLDGPNIRVYALRHQGRIAATALVAVEGGLGPALSRDIFAGRRRPRGHLLPQTLCAHAGLQEAPALGYARVIRIAVHPAARRRGLGRSLLAGIVRDARALGLDLVGSSFGATGELLRFWRRCDHRPIHLGTRRNAASGAYAAVVSHPLTPAGASLHATAETRLGERLPLLLTEPLRDLEPELAAHLLRDTPRGTWSPGPEEHRELAAFAHASRPYEATLPLLARLVPARIGEPPGGALDDAARALLIGKVLQRHTWAETARRSGLTGKAQVLARLRIAVGKLIGSAEPVDPGLVRGAPV